MPELDLGVLNLVGHFDTANELQSGFEVSVEDGPNLPNVPLNSNQTFKLVSKT